MKDYKTLLFYDRLEMTHKNGLHKWVIRPKNKGLFARVASNFLDINITRPPATAVMHNASWM